MRKYPPLWSAVRSRSAVPATVPERCSVRPPTAMTVHPDAVRDIDGGKMDGFVKSAEQDSSRGCGAANPTPSVCLPSSPPDVMGYHDAREIPNYWTYAEDFTLDDHMFEPVASWSLPSSLYKVSEWSASCSNASNPSSCHTALQWPNPDWVTGSVADINGPSDQTQHYAWTDITYLLHGQNVNWGYYVMEGS